MGVNVLVSKILNEVGIRPERSSLQWVSAAEAPRFVSLINQFTARIKDLGPLGQADGLKDGEIKSKLQQAVALVSDKTFRIAFGNIAVSLRKEGGEVTEARISELVDRKLSRVIATAFGSAIRL